MILVFLNNYFGVGEEGREISGGGVRVEIAWLLYADDLVLCGESEEDLKAMVMCFVEVCRRRGLKVNVDKSKVMVSSGEERLECEMGGWDAIGACVRI